MQIVLGEKTFTMDVADTEVTQSQGLSGRSELLENGGMIFIFQNPDKYGFWMKDMLFPIDIIWIDQNFKIIHVEKSLLPSSYPKVFTPESLALYVLEIKAGEWEKLNLKIGDRVEFTQK